MTEAEPKNPLLELKAHVEQADAGQLAAMTLILAMSLLGLFAAKMLDFSFASKWFTDECFHVYMAEDLASHGRLRTFIPELYGGFYNFYNPLFHITGALAYRLAEEAGMVALNPVLALGVILVLLLLGKRVAGTGAAAITALLLFLSPLFRDYSVRFYSEMLTTLVYSAFFIAFWLALERDESAWIYASGAALGLMFWVKYSALAVGSFLVVIFIYRKINSDVQTTVKLRKIGLIATIVALPLLIRNLAAFGNPVYPILSSAHIDPVLKQAHYFIFKPSAFVLLDNIFTGWSWFPVLVAIAGVGLGLYRGSSYRLLALLNLSVFLMLFAVPVISARHFLFLLPVSIFMGVTHLQKFLKDERWIAIVLVVVTIVMALQYPYLRNPREKFNLDTRLETALQTFEPLIPKESVVLSLWTYSTLYYLKRPATWPTIYTDHPPKEVFYAAKPDDVYGALRQYDIDYVIVDGYRVVKEIHFSAYPERFVAGLSQLVGDGRAKMLAVESGMNLIRVM